MDHDEKYKKEIIRKLETLCPNAKNPASIVGGDDDNEKKRLFLIDEWRHHYLSMNKVLIEEEFKKNNWSPVPELTGDLAYLAALNKVMEETKHY
jgi:hypothetical protein